MDEADFRYLIGPEGVEALAQLSPDDLHPNVYLHTATRLRNEVGPEKAHALLETIALRERATGKFDRTHDMLFIREALEQSSGEAVANYRASRFAACGFGLVGDLGCGIGGDSLALAAQTAVLGVERDPLRLQLARYNVGVYGRGGNFSPVCADLQEIAPLAVDAFFVDPARRTASHTRSAPSRRLRSLHDYQPPWSVVESWLETVPHAAMKTAPGVDYDEVPANAGLEFVSVRGEVKEGIFWFGDLRTAAVRRATLLPAGYTISTESDEPAIDAVMPAEFLYEPDGAVIRAHLVRTLAADLGANLIDPTIAYLTSHTLRPTPFARAFRLEAVFPFQLKRLRRYLRERNVGQVVIKKRGSPLDPEDLRRALRLSGVDERTVFLTQVLGQPTVLIGQPVQTDLPA